MSFNDRKLARNEQMDRRFMFMKLFWAQGTLQRNSWGYMYEGCPESFETVSVSLSHLYALQ